MAKLVVDGTEIEVPDHYTVLQACEAGGAEIPRFCFHERLSIAGNCRMCLVEWQGAPKPIASCAMGVMDLRPDRDGTPPKINTKTPSVRKAREGVMEFLLINHPLDCPICDQGGECDLQDQAMAYGVDASRYQENKRAVEDKYIGPLVKTIMTRCIHCTRCVRFSTEVAGVPDLGATGRGEDMEITTYLEGAMGSEMQGNVIDLCPVGALTSKPYAFSARPWELRKTESIDVMDAVGSNIRVDTRGPEVMRIMPRVNEAVNEEWISDKTRFIWDGLRSQRLDKPYVRFDGKLTPTGWQEAFVAAKSAIEGVSPDRIGIVAGPTASVEELYAAKALMAALGSPNLDIRAPHSPLHPSHGRASFLFNSTIEGIEDADALMIVGSNPRKEAPVLNARIRKRWRMGNFPIAVIGENADLTYDYVYLGAGPQTVAKAAGNLPAGAERPMMIIGQGALNRPDGAAVLSTAAKVAMSDGLVGEEWNGFNVLHTDAAQVGGLDIGFVPGDGGKTTADMLAGGVDVLFLLGADEYDLSGAADATIIYIGTHGDRGAHAADIILPGAAYTEKPGTFVNTEGRPQTTLRAAFPPGDARADWAILRALSGVLDKPLPFDSFEQLRAAVYADYPHLMRLDAIEPADPGTITALASPGGQMASDPFHSSVADFHLTNPIARASRTMAECSALAAARTGEATGTDG